MPASLPRPRFPIRPDRLRPFLLQHAESIRNPRQPMLELNPFVCVVARRARGGRRHGEQMHGQPAFCNTAA